MAHGLICGMSESGKTTLAKRLAAEIYARNKPVIVLDPMNDPEWPCDYRTTDQGKFLEAFWSNQECFCFIDESAQMVGRYDTLMQETATRGRHHGHSVFFICQRGAQIASTVRAQCRYLSLFCSAKDDCKILANEFNKPELLNANTLPQFHFYHASRFGGCTLQNLGVPHAKSLPADNRRLGQDTDAGDAGAENDARRESRGNESAKRIPRKLESPT